MADSYRSVILVLFHGIPGAYSAMLFGGNVGVLYRLLLARGLAQQTEWHSYQLSKAFQIRAFCCWDSISLSGAAKIRRRNGQCRSIQAKKRCGQSEDWTIG